MLKVKIFLEHGESQLEDRVNEFLVNISDPSNLIDIKFSASITGDTSTINGRVDQILTAIVLYKDYSKS